MTMGENLIEFDDDGSHQKILQNKNSIRGRAASFTNYYRESLDDEVNPLQAVFNSCDYNGDGFVKISDLLNLAKQHASSTDNNNGGVEEELQFMLEQLDVKGDGKITFDEFVAKIHELIQEPNNEEDDIIEDEKNVIDHDIVPEIEIPHDDLVNNRPRSYTDSEGFFEEADTTSHSTASTNDYNGDTEDPAFSTPLKSTPIKNKRHDIYSTFPPNGKHPKKTRTTLFEIRERQLSRTSEYQSQEDGFESNEDNEESYYSLPLSQTPSSSRLAARNIATSQSARASLHGSREEMGYNATHHKHSLSDSEADYGFLTDQIQKLSAQLSLMQMDQSNHNDQQSKIQEDNKVLVNRYRTMDIDWLSNISQSPMISEWTSLIQKVKIVLDCIFPGVKNNIFIHRGYFFE